MATTSNIAPTTAERRPTIARSVTLFAVLVGTVLAGFATARLAAVVAATPAAALLIDNPPFVDTAVNVDPAVTDWARYVSRLVNDPALLRAKLPACLNLPGTDAEREECDRATYAALNAAPSRGELWLFRATTLFNRGAFGPHAYEALRNSYRVAPAEGWVASGRVILALRLYPALPADLQDLAKQDLRVVLKYPALSALLADAYNSDGLLRQAARPALESLDKTQLDTFLWSVQSSMPE